MAALVALQTVAFETLGQSEAWQAAFTSLAAVPTPLLAGLGFAVAVGATWAGWTAAAPSARRPAAT